MRGGWKGRLFPGSAKGAEGGRQAHLRNRVQLFALNAARQGRAHGPDLVILLKFKGGNEKWKLRKKILTKR